MWRNERCTSLIGDVVAASDSTQTQFRIVGQTLHLPYKLFYFAFCASRRRIMNNVTSADAAQMIAPNASAKGVPAKCATAPASRLPSGIIAPNTSDHTPMTRPRISSGTIVCNRVFDVEKNNSIPNPAANRNRSASEKLLVNENASIAAENSQTPPSASLRGVKRCPYVATIRAPTNAPVPLADIRTP